MNNYLDRFATPHLSLEARSAGGGLGEGGETQELNMR